MPTVDCSVILVTYQSAAYVRRCVESVAQATHRVSFEILAVDNASDDDTVALLERGQPPVRVLRNETNLGFGRAANRAAREAQGRYLLLLNPDTEVQDHAIDRAVAFADAHPDIGILGGKLLNPDGTLQRAARRSIPYPSVAFFQLSGLGRVWRNHPAAGAYNLERLDPEETADVGAVSGAFLLIRKEIWDRVGGFDERFFLYGEDLDLCLSVTRLGYRVVYYPEAAVLHHKGASSRQARRRANREFHRAMRLFHDKHFAAGRPFLVNAAVRGGIAVRGTLNDWALRLGLRRHVGTKG
jgi:GT2 family glycosyltransferase